CGRRHGPADRDRRGDRRHDHLPATAVAASAALRMTIRCGFVNSAFSIIEASLCEDPGPVPLPALPSLRRRHDSDLPDPSLPCLPFAPDAAAERALEPLRAICRVLTVRGPLPRGPLRRAWTTLASPLPDMALRNASPTYAGALRQLLAAEQFEIVQAESIEM